MEILVILAVLLLLGLVVWWLRSAKGGHVTETPDRTVQDAQHEEG